MNLLALAVLVGSALPLLIALIQQQQWTTRVKTIVTVVFVVIAAVGGLFAHGNWHGWNLVTAHAFVTILAGLILGTWGSYAHLWQNLGLTQWVERVSTIRSKVVSAIDQLPPDQRAQLELEAQRLLHTQASLPPAAAPPAVPPPAQG